MEIKNLAQYDKYMPCIHGKCSDCKYNVGETFCEAEYYVPASLVNQTKFEHEYEALCKRFASPVPGTPPTYEYAIEECAELIQAIQHAKRGRNDANPVKEMAHVYMLLDSLKIHWNISDEEIRRYQQELIDRYGNTPNDGRHIPEQSSLVNQTKED